MTLSPEQQARISLIKNRYLRLHEEEHDKTRTPIPDNQRPKPAFYDFAHYPDKIFQGNPPRFSGSIRGSKF